MIELYFSAGVGSLGWIDWVFGRYQ